MHGGGEAFREDAEVLPEDANDLRPVAERQQRHRRKLGSSRVRGGAGDIERSAHHDLAALSDVPKPKHGESGLHEHQRDQSGGFNGPGCRAVSMLANRRALGETRAPARRG